MGRPTPPPRAPLEGKAPAVGMPERGGRVRSQIVEHPRSETRRPIILSSVDTSGTLLVSDQHPAYRNMKRDLPHETVNHELEYVRSDNPNIHTQNIENYWSIFTRGLHGTFHHISTNHLPMNLHEFDFSASRREVSDAERFCALMSQVSGRLLWYSSADQPKNLYA